MDTIVIGGGIAGLCCAKTLHDAGHPFALFEASDHVGGRIATDEVDGFLLDRGFQVFLTSYEEARRVLDYASLDLQPFEPGALTFHNGKFHRLSDPWRRPQHFLATAMSGAATLGDKMRISGLRSEVASGSVEDLFARPEQTTWDRLRSAGFSETILERFFRPFMSGVFLEPHLATSSRMFEFVFRMFGQGDASLPADGMRAIPRQVASQLPPDAVHLQSSVRQLDGQTITLASGATHTAKNIVLATDNPNAAELGGIQQREQCGVSCVYFAVDKAPLQEAILVLNGEGRGPINNLCVPNRVAAKYAPAGQDLVSATVLGVNHGDSLTSRVVSQMVEWFGGSAGDYRYLRTYEIPFALPSQVTLDPVEKSPRIREGLYRCGDDMDTASINGAMASGRRAAEAILAS